MSTPKELTAEWLIEVAIYPSPAGGGCTVRRKKHNGQTCVVHVNYFKKPFKVNYSTEKCCLNRLLTTTIMIFYQTFTTCFPRYKLHKKRNIAFSACTSKTSAALVYRFDVLEMTEIQNFAEGSYLFH